MPPGNQVFFSRQQPAGDGQTAFHEPQVMISVLFLCQISQLMTETGREGLTESALNRYNADKPAANSVPAPQGSCVASEASTGTSVAASFFAR